MNALCAVCFIGIALAQTPALPASSLPIDLVMVLVDPASPSKSTCLVKCATHTATLGPGDRACNLAEIDEIRTDFIIVRNLATKQRERLMFRNAAAPAPREIPPPPVEDAATGAGDVTVEVPKDTLTYSLANIPQVLGAALATPRYQDTPDGQRVVNGFSIGQIVPGSIVDQLGLRNGDVILEINGTRLDGIATVLRLVSQTSALTQATMTVLRDGQRMMIVVRTR